MLFFAKITDKTVSVFQCFTGMLFYFLHQMKCCGTHGIGGVCCYALPTVIARYEAISELCIANIRVCYLYNVYLSRRDCFVPRNDASGAGLPSLPETSGFGSDNCFNKRSTFPHTWVLFCKWNILIISILKFNQ
jgi:hypothetical protein